MRPDIDLRGYLDTRGTAITLAISVLALAGTAVLAGLIQPVALDTGLSDVSLTMALMSLPLSLIIPVVAVVITAGEWSDRSVQVTLQQRPSRLAVMASKAIAALIMSAVLIALSIGLASLTTLIGGELLGEGAVFSTFDDVMTTQLAVLGAVVLFSIAMGLLTQSTVIGLIAAIGIPFVVSTAGGIAMLLGSDLVSDILRALDLQTAASQLGTGDAGAFELLPLLILVIAPGLLGARRWAVREVG
ncbi:ABC transporter permease [Brachybacterium sp. DNPG3]